MEYLKLALTYIMVGIILDIPLVIRWINTKESSVLEYRLKLQFFLALVMVLASLITTHLLKIDEKVFDMIRDGITAIGVNITFLFIKKK